MPSPFPGMDPYIEGSSCWRDFHSRLLTTISDVLNPRMRPKYITRVEERVYVSDETDLGRKSFVPDLSVVAIPGAGWGDGERGGTVVAIESAEAVEITQQLQTQVLEKFLQVIDVADRKVVAVIEILSPSNKIRGSRGQREYESKREQVLGSDAHLIEIDLLREGDRYSHLDDRPFDYSVFLSRWIGDGRRKWIWPILLRQRLPSIPIPLRGDDPDVPLDLQAIVSAVYDRGSYDLDIDYRQPPLVKLHQPATVWTEQLLQSKGLREGNP